MQKRKSCFLPLILVLFITFHSLLLAQATDECNTYTVIDNVNRSTSNIIDPTKQTPLCDLIWRTGWYRFKSKAGGEIPNSCPAQNSCGASGSIWARGTMPQATGNITTMTACVRFDSDCCAWNWDIKAKKCSFSNGTSYYVYYLRGAKGCSMSYCAGSERPCKPGEISANGYTPGCREYACNSYTVIDNVNRSTSNIIDPAKQTPLSDHTLSTKWYRFNSKAGGMMPNSCPPMYSCGTSGSIWARGTMPQGTGKFTQMTACVRSGCDCCASNWNIGVKKCSENGTSFYVYNLATPTGSSMAYCAGSERPCDYGFISPNGYTPNCRKMFPTIIGSPKIKPGIRNKRLEFTCEFQSSDTDPSSIFEVTWYQGSRAEKIKLTQTLRGTERKASLQNSHKTPNQKDKIFFKLGRVIFCRVRSRLSCSSTYSNFKESNRYFAGIMVVPQMSHFQMTERDKKPLKLTLKATVPIQCQTITTCSVRVMLRQSGTDDFVSACVIEFSQTKTGHVTQEKILEVFAKRDFSNKGNREMFVNYDVFESTDPIDWSGHNKIPEVKISVRDVQTAQCSSTSDPNFLTFDGRYYGHYQAGDYVLVKSSCREFEVHARTWQCGGGSCNCGVAAREGDDVIVIDMCRDRTPIARYASTVEPAIGTSISRDSNGKTFMIKFPSGTSIKFGIASWRSNTRSNWLYADITVKVPSDDYNNCTSGLCGTFDGNIANEFTAKDGSIHNPRYRYPPSENFTESWKIPVNSSLFYYEGGEPKCREKTEHYCQCQLIDGKLTSNCRFATIAARPEYKMEGWTELKFPNLQNCGRRKKRSTSKEISLPNDLKSMIYVYDPAPVPRVSASWPTKSGKTLTQVRAYCTDEVTKSQAGLVCRSIADFDFQPFISQCTEDIKISDDYAISSSAVMALQSSCEEIFLKNVSYWQVDPAKNGSLGPPIEIAETLCPSLCSGNGRCVNATCICNSNYTSADCSIEKNKGPTVTSIPLNGLCDVRKRSDCEKIRVNGRDFLDSDKLSCRSQHLKVSEKPYEKLSKADITFGFMLSFAQTMCQLKSNPVKTAGDPTNTKSIPHAGYLLDISNDGKTFSSESPMYLIYDSKCMDCSVTGVCVPKADTCIINGYCFNKDETHPTDPCLICKPSMNTKQFYFTPSCNVTSAPWTTVHQASSVAPPACQGSDCPGSNNVVVIVCSIIGGLIFVVIVAVIIIIQYKKNRAKVIKVQPAETAIKKIKGKMVENATGATFVNPSYEGTVKEAFP